jgi:hypothetical protein
VKNAANLFLMKFVPSCIVILYVRTFSSFKQGKTYYITFLHKIKYPLIVSSPRFHTGFFVCLKNGRKI